MIIVDSLKYSQEKKGLEIFGYCIMSSHIHLIARAQENYQLSDWLRDFKKFTSKAIIRKILEEKDSKKRSLSEVFCNKESGKSKYSFWETGNHPVEISSNKFFDEKLDYIHNNPVEASLVVRPEDYLFSSARNYAGLKSHLEIVLESVKLRTYK
jgi:REP element-mobilizing transposase RayT